MNASNQIVNYFVEKTGTEIEDLQRYIQQTELANELLESYPIESIMTCIDVYAEKIHSLAYLSYVIAKHHSSVMAAKVQESILDSFKNWETPVIDGKEVVKSTPKWVKEVSGHL